MKTLPRSFPIAFVALFLILFMTSYGAIGGIFKAGAYTGIIIVVAVLIWLASKFLGGGGNRNVQSLVVHKKVVPLNKGTTFL